MTGDPTTFKLGMDVLLTQHSDWLKGRRIGFVSHSAAVDAAGIISAEKLRHYPGVNLVALFGPEHGFRGQAAAGDQTADETHSEWAIPIYSLYGQYRKPTPDMLNGLDVLVVEFQDLGARPYTYVATLALVLAAAAENHLPVIVADRPIPLPLGSDGPVTEAAFTSFVAALPFPMHYGMTPAETARWIQAHTLPDLDLRVVAMSGYACEGLRQPVWPPWVPPSPRIQSWESATLFTCTVFGEALPALDYGSGTGSAFQLLGAPWLDCHRLIDELCGYGLPGLTLEATTYYAKSGIYKDVELSGVRLIVTDTATFRPIRTCVTLLEIITRLYGPDPLWAAPGTRPDWFDSLFGTETVRKALLAGTSAAEITANWQPALQAYRLDRAPSLLYTLKDKPPSSPLTHISPSIYR